jgi:hypothetical protein
MIALSLIMGAAMQLSDQHDKARGIFAIDVFRHGVLVEHFEDDNLIVDLGREIVTKLLGGDVSGRSIAKIGFGTNGSAAAPGNVALTGSFIKSIDARSYPTTTSVSFTFSLSTAEANGLEIREFGLITSAGTLFARKVRTAGALIKDSDMSISGSWRLLY